MTDIHLNMQTTTEQCEDPQISNLDNVRAPRAHAGLFFPGSILELRQ